MDIAFAIQTSYIVASVTILTVKLLPPLGNRFLAYGSRSAESSGNKSSQSTGKGDVGSTGIERGILDYMAGLKVPHSWFASFYLTSIATSLFWAPQILCGIGLVPYAAVVGQHSIASMTARQVLVTWSMMLVQGCRRLYESLAFAKTSSSQMWIGHWAMGIWFYATMSVAVWIDGIPIILEQGFKPAHFLFVTPSPRTFVATLLFMFSSGIQHDCHAYLASLKKYTLPEHPVFQPVVCPHYLAECLIYLAMSIMAAPPGQIVNRTVFSGFIFVVINLGVTADGTRKWYAQKFGKDKVSGRSRMVPYIY